MGAIKDIVDLTTQLSSSVQDRKLAAEILQIQTLILVVQRDDAQLVTENLDLKKKIFNLDKEISDCKSKITTLEKRNSELVQSHSEEIAALKKRQLEQMTASHRQEPEDESPLTFGLRNKR